MAKRTAQKWKTLIHNGPIFPEPYTSKGYKLKDKNLNLTAENILWDLSSYIDSEYFKELKWKKNLQNLYNLDIHQHLTPEQRQCKFPEDFLPLLKQMKKDKLKISEKKKNRSKEEKEKEKAEKEQLKEKYGYAFFDNVKTELTTYVTEGSRIFIGRGSHPLTLRWIPPVQPENITINCSSNPPKPPKGHLWKKVECNPKTTMTFYYPIELIHTRKFATINPKSEKGMDKNKEKFDKVKNLAENWSKVEKYINKNLSNPDLKTQECALVSYLIKNFGIRVGNDERAEGEDFVNDVVGASTLRKENLILVGENRIHLKFLGKDSVPYDKEVEVNSDFFKQTQKKLKNIKSDGDFLFPNIRASEVNIFLEKVLKGITARSFRTSYGSALLAEALRQLEIKKEEPLSSVKIKLDEAQLVVAKKLNHQRNINQKSLNKATETAKETEKKLKEKLKELEKKLKEESNKEKKNKLKERISRHKEKLELNKKKLSLKEKTADSSIQTSRQAYSDPRVLFSFCKDKEIPIEKIYSKSLLDKFRWALDVEVDFYKNYPSIT